MQVDFNVKDLVYTGALIGLGYLLKKTDNKLERINRNSFQAFEGFKRQMYSEMDHIWDNLNKLAPKEAKK